MKHSERDRPQAATAAYASDGRTQWQASEHAASGWHTTFDSLLGSGHIFMGQTYTDAGMLFRGMPAGLRQALRTDRLWHSAHASPLCGLERELNVIFCSEVARDALAVARPWEDQGGDAVILVFAGRVFAERWRARSAAVLGFADVGMVFKYPCLAEPLAWRDIHAAVVQPAMLSECESLLADRPAAERPKLIAPAAADVSRREAWQSCIDDLMDSHRLTAAVSQPTTDLPRHGS